MPNDILGAQLVKLTGAGSTGTPTNYVNADLNGNLQVVDEADGTPGSPPPSKAIQVAGSDGTDLRTMRTASDGTVRIDPTGTTTQPISGTVTANQGSAGTLANAWSVKVTDGTNTLPTGDAAARKIFTALTDGTNTTAVKPASTAALATDPSAVVALSPNSPIPAGSNNIGSITNITGTVSLPTGASTSANQTNGSQKTQIVDGSGNVQPAGDTAAHGIFVKPTDGTNVPAVKAASTAVTATDPSMAVGLSPNSPLPAGTNSIGSVVQGTAAALSGKWPVQVTDGTNIMPTMDVAARAGFQKITDGTNTMPTMDTAARSGFVRLTDGTNTQAVKPASTAALATDPSAVVALSPNSPLPAGTNAIGTVKAQLQDNAGAAITLGQKNMAASVPVAIASDQSGLNSNLDKNQTGTIGALNANVVIATNGMASVVVTVTGTWSANLAFQGFDGTNWINASALTIPAGGITTSLSANGSALVNCGGFSQLRLIATSYTSGTANVFMNAGAGTSLVEVYNDSQNPLVAQVVDASKNAITSTSINSKQRLDVNLPSEGQAGSAAPFDTVQVGGTDGTDLRAITTDTSGNQKVVGSVASGASDSGNPLKTGAVFNTTLPSVTNGERVDSQADANGRHIVTNAPLDGSKTTYSASVTGLVAANTPTDIFTITGSASKTIRITRISFSGTQNGSGARDVLLIKRSAANTGGTSTTETGIPHDSTNTAATATVRAYTVNPSALGAAVGTIRTKRIILLATNVTNPLDSIIWDFGDRPAQAIVLRGTSEVLAINLNGVTSTTNLLDIDIEWTEE